MTTPTNLETYFLQLVNETRAKAGVKPLTFDGELSNNCMDI
jgi:serralysin